MPGRIDARLAELKIELPKAAAPVANYVPVVIAGGLAFVSGQVTAWNGEIKFRGKLGRDSRSSRGRRRPGSARSTSSLSFALRSAAISTGRSAASSSAYS